MESGQQNLQNILEDDLSSELINAGRFCFSCEQIFTNRQCLEEHVCSSASYICSCGTEFTEYKDMQEHSTTHEPGHQVLDHETIKKRRIEKRIEEAQQLRRLQTGEVVWKTPKLNRVSESVSLPTKPILQGPITSSHLPSHPPMQSAQISRVPRLYPSVSQASLLPNLATSGTDMRNVFGDVGAPTVDLWAIYQPVVLLPTIRKFNKKKTYSCGKCEQCFLTRTSLVCHYNFHIKDKISGCIGCGLLLSSKKVVPHFHVCNSSNGAMKYSLITARPPSYTKLNEDSSERNQDQRAQGPQSASILSKSQNVITTSKSTCTPCVTSTVKLKNENIRTYSKNNCRVHVNPSLQSKSPNLSSSKLCGNVTLPSKSQIPNPSASINNCQGFPVAPFGLLNKPTNSVLSKTANTSSGPNGFTCRVCRVPFETAHMLQRHKCAKAQEFMAQHAQSGRYKLKRVKPVASPVPAQMNGERKLAIQTSENIKKHQVLAVTLDNNVDMDDDCYIVESGPDKPAEMIYQVTSSVPIKT